MLKRIVLCVALSLLLACLVTAAGVFGSLGALGYILEPGTFFCRKFLSSHFTGEIDGDMITAVIWLNFAFYALVIFAILIYARAFGRSSEETKA